MQADDGEHTDVSLPPRQTWYPPRRRFNVRLFTAGSVLMVAAAIFALAVVNEGSSVVLGVLFALQAVNFAVQARLRHRTEVTADRTGLHIMLGRGRLTVPWQEITEIRPSIARARTTYLVLVGPSGGVTDLPVSEEHLAELRHWHAATR